MSLRAAVFLFIAGSTIVMVDAPALSDETAPWREYSQQPNGDIHFFDSSRVETAADLRKVWNRIRYKTSVMGAASYQSLLEIDCAQRTERILQNTFFSDKHWKTPSMGTDKTAKPKRQIAKGSATERLSGILCEQ
ncbi:MAG: surface-adhesin E family protein [Pseudomonadota bacterium]